MLLLLLYMNFLFQKNCSKDVMERKNTYMGKNMFINLHTLLKTRSQTETAY